MIEGEGFVQGTTKLITDFSGLVHKNIKKKLNWHKIKLFYDNIFKTPSLPNHKPKELKVWEKVQLPPPVMCFVSCVMCHISHTLFRGEASRWRVCYQLDYHASF